MDTYSPSIAGGRVGAWASFRAPGFRLLTGANLFAAIDMNVRTAVHGWLVLELSHNSAFWVGIYALLLGLGQFFFSTAAGALLDRFQRRNVLLVEITLSAAIAVGLASAIIAGIMSLWMAMLVAPVIGCLRAVRFIGMHRFVYDIVGPRQLVNGISLWRLSSAPMTIFGAILAGWLIQSTGIGAAYAFMGLCDIIGLSLLALIRIRGEVAQVAGNLLKQMAEGLGYARSNRSLRTLFTISLLMEGLGFSFLIMVPVVAKNVLETGGIGLGFLQAGVGLGMVMGTLIMARIGDSMSKTQIIFLNALLAGVALIGFGLSRSLPLSVFLAMCVMGFLNAYDLTLDALMQLVSPPALRGRAVSLHSLAISFTALGGFVMGVVGSFVGVPVVLTAAGAGIVVNSLIRRPALMRLEERMTTPPEPPEPAMSGG